MGKFDDTGLNLLKSLEGCRLTAYIDVAGVWTIGYGHTGHEVVPGLCWPQDLADSTLLTDTDQFAAGVAKLITAELNDNQFSALVIFAYNIGLAGFAGSTALHRVNGADLNDVPAAMMLWNKAHDPHSGELVVSQGLVNRRNAEIALWNTAV